MKSGLSGRTTICGLIGDPVEHSMSPAMHNAAFSQLGLDYAYIAFRVKPADLSKAIEGMRALNMRGLNVTIPYKVAVMALLDNIDPLAKQIGAVNTIVNDNGVLTGYNTDAPGFLQPLLEKGIDPKGKNIVIIGAGGAARGITFILAERGAKLKILNRQKARAEELAAHISHTFGSPAAAQELSPQTLRDALANPDILVNTTSVGMSPNYDETPVPAQLLRSGMTVYDVVYNPVETRLLKEAKAAGAQTIGGLDMLVWQGAIAFEKWTGKKPPVDLMKQEALKLLQH